MRAFQDLQGKEVALGRFLGRGGEGAVYSVPSRPRLVAKIYARTPRDPMGHKLAAMVQLGTEQLTALTAWPQDLLLDERTGNVVGFLMPRVEEHQGIHALYGPTNRKTAFPEAMWDFLVHAARNVAATFDTVHQHGHVIGDVNEGNIVVSQTATVRLIDCDSFQITHLGRTYPCRVGVPLYTPPELQGRRLDDVVRTPDDDRFGLAVLVFQLLFMGRHPFAGLHPERAMPVGMAIRENLFAFGQEAARQGWEPPPFSLRLTDVSSSVAQLFERAFGRDAAAGGLRPTAAEWVTVLGELEEMTVTCGESTRHVYVKINGSCPWCRIEKEGGPSFFYLEGRATQERRREILEAYQGLKTRGHYEVLGIDQSSTEAQIKEAYFRLAKRFHPDSPLDPALADLRPELEAIFIRLVGAHEVLRHDRSRASYDEMRGHAAAAPGAGTPAATSASVVPAPMIDPEIKGRLAPESITEDEAMVRYLTDEERKETGKISAVQKLYRLNTAEKAITALRGNREERAILVRDPNRIVAAAVLGSPKLTDAEIESFAAMQNVSDHVLRAIGTNKEWTKKYTVVSSLVKNPRTPIGIAMTMLSRLTPRDMKSVAFDNNVPEAVRKAAQKFMGFL